MKHLLFLQILIFSFYSTISKASNYFLENDWIDSSEDTPQDATLDPIFQQKFDGNSFLIHLDGSFRQQYQSRNIKAMLTFNVPLERFSRQKRVKPANQEFRLAQTEPTSVPESIIQSTISPVPQNQPASNLPISPSLMDQVLQEALKNSHFSNTNSAINQLKSASKTSALLPEIRFRALRNTSEDLTMSPTEYDPNRTTVAGGISWGLDLRVGWKLDKLIFSDEHIQLEKMRKDLAEEKKKFQLEIIDLLSDWQTAWAMEHNSMATDEQIFANRLKRAKIESTLHLYTNGWFTKWVQTLPLSNSQ